MNLKLNQIEKIYFCTGARNVEILNLFPKDKVKLEFDERMASFKALGRTKLHLSPVAICTTSGTAVSECISSMLEAKYSGLPLILITGDRPKKLHGSGAPQTIDHEALTVGARGSYLEVTLDGLKNLDLQNVIYPIHINVLIDDTKPHALEVKRIHSMDEVTQFFEENKKPLFLFSHENSSMKKFIEKFKLLNLPFYAEVLSGGREHSSIKTEKRLIEAFKKNEFDSIVRIGHTPLSKIWRLLESSPRPVLSFDDRDLPGLSFGKVMKKSSSELLNDKTFWNVLSRLSPFKIEDKTKEHLNVLINKYPDSEISLMAKLQRHLPEKAKVYLGNSLIIRFFELTQEVPFEVYGSRGVNGIDGQLATAIGLAESTDDLVYCILGDVTTFYDLSSLREMPKNLRLIIMNNNGGRIFDMLKLDQRIILEHNFDFKDICEGFNLSYIKDDLNHLSHIQVTEFVANVSSGQAFLQEWMA